MNTRAIWTEMGGRSHAVHQPVWHARLVYINKWQGYVLKRQNTYVRVRISNKCTRTCPSQITNCTARNVNAPRAEMKHIIHPWNECNTSGTRRTISAKRIPPWMTIVCRQLVVFAPTYNPIYIVLLHESSTMRQNMSGMCHCGRMSNCCQRIYSLTYSCLGPKESLRRS